MLSKIELISMSFIFIFNADLYFSVYMCYHIYMKDFLTPLLNKENELEILSKNIELLYPFLKGDVLKKINSKKYSVPSSWLSFNGKSRVNIELICKGFFEKEYYIKKTHRIKGSGPYRTKTDAIIDKITNRRKNSYNSYIEDFKNVARYKNHWLAWWEQQDFWIYLGETNELSKIYNRVWFDIILSYSAQNKKFKIIETTQPSCTHSKINYEKISQKYLKQLNDIENVYEMLEVLFKFSKEAYGIFMIAQSPNNRWDYKYVKSDNVIGFSVELPKVGEVRSLAVNDFNIYYEKRGNKNPYD